MPRILESDALSLARGIDAMPEDKRTAALDILGRYKAQQDDEGEPHWPTVARQQQQTEERFRSMFDDLANVDKAAPSLAAILPYSENPNAERARVASIAHLSRLYGKPTDEIGASFELYRDDYAKKRGAKSGLDDLGVYALAKADVQKRIQTESTVLDGVKAALRGEDSIRALAEWQAKNADRAKEDSGAFMSGYRQALEKDGAFLPMADRILGLLESQNTKNKELFTSEKAAELGQMVEQMAGMKKAERKSIYRAISARVEAAGYEPKGFWAQMLGELDKGLYRMSGTLGTQAGLFSDIVTAQAGASERQTDLLDGMAVSMPVLSSEEQAALLRQRDYRERIGNVQSEIQDIVAGVIDPVTPTLDWMNDTIERGAIKGPGAVLPFMAASAALGPWAGGALFAADFAEQNRRELVNMGLDADQARKVGMLAAPAQAAVESLSNLFQLGRFPAVQQALQSFTKPVAGASLLTRYVQNAGLAFATEFTEEQLQDNVIVPMSQTLLGALEKDMPDVDWSFYKERAIQSSPELAATLLPMALVFGGMMTAADAKLSEQMTANVDALTALNFSQAQATEIVQEKTPEDRIAKAASLWRSRAGNRATLEQGAKNLAERLGQLSTDTAAYQAELERRGVLPRVMHTAADEWQLTFNDGSIATFPDHQQASAARWTWAEDQLGKTHALTREALTSLERNMDTNRELAVEFKPDVRTLQNVADEGGNMEQLKRRVEQGKALGDVSPDEAFDTASIVDRATADADGFLSSLQILGSSRNEFKDGVLRTTIRLWEGSNVLTLVEEKLEGDAKAIIASRGGRAWMLGHLRNYEQESGDKLFRDTPDEGITDDDLAEAWSHLGQSYLVGRSSFGAPLQQNNMRRFSRLLMRAGLAGALNSESTFWQAVVNRAQKLGELKAAGKLGDDLAAELEKQLGIDSQLKHEQGAVKEAQNVANEVAQEASDWVDDSEFAGQVADSETFSVRAENGRLLINGEDVGLFEFTDKGNVVEVDRLYIDKDKQRKGYGRAAVAYLFDRFPNASFVEAYPLVDAPWVRLGASSMTEDGAFLIPRPSRAIPADASKQTQETFSLRVTPAQDAEYMAAVEAGDMQTAQRMVDDAAKAAGYNVGPVKHGTATEFTSFDSRFGGKMTEALSAKNAFFLTDDDKTAMSYAVYAAEDGPVKEALAKADKAEKRGDWNAYDKYTQEAESLDTYDSRMKLRKNARIINAYIKGDFLEFDAEGKTPQELHDGDIDAGVSAEIKKAKRQGKTGVVYRNLDDAINLSNRPATHYAVFRPSQIKSADPVTRDDSGNVIPLSQRFNPADDRITYSLRPGDFASRVEAMFSPFQRSPEARLVMARVAKERALRLGNELVEKAGAIRSASNIAREQRFREADATEQKIQAYLDSLTPEARQTLEFDPEDLDADPLISAMLNDNGKLMSRTTAAKLGKVESKAGDFDGAPWLPPAWYSKGSGIMPDVMAQNLHDAGLLPDAYTDTLWNELSKRIESKRKDKAAHREAVQAFKDAKKAASESAKAEAAAWAENAKKQAGSGKAQRERIKAWLRVLDGILAAVPPEVRARVGGFVKMAGIATDEAALNYLEDRVAKLDKELEKWLKKDAVGSINRLFKKAAADYTAGKKAKGKLGPDEHYLFQRAEAASEMDAAALRGELAKLDALAEDESLSDDQRTLAVLERGIVELVGDMKNADSGRLFTAFDALKQLYMRGVIEWKTKQAVRREERKAAREALQADAGKSGVLKERQAMEKSMATLFGKAKSAWLSVSSFSEVLRYAFGSKSQQVTELIDAERESSNAYEDEQQAIADELETFFKDMAGGKVLDGERLRYDMAQRTIKAGDIELSQFEAITALLMWRQEDGRRHMEGTFDENGQRTSSWGYDQAWIDEVQKQLTPEATRFMGWLSAKYGSEHGELNALYRERHGVNLPAHDNYAPITVKPMQAKAGEMVDPVSGATVSGSILTPGSLRTRSRMAVAEPEFRDALQTFIGHKKQMGYWKAYYDLATDVQAVLGNRELMNAVEAAAGAEAVIVLGKWVTVLAQGGVRDAAAGLAMNGMFQRMMNRAATVGLLGRVSTLLVQSTQLAAASVQMPVGAYLTRFGKLLAGQLDWKGAIQSAFIQRRIQSAPPIVRQAMENLGTATRPNLITRAVRNLGNLLSGADGLFTGGTYAILLDYHRETGRKLGLAGADLEEHAHREAERATEQVAQPTRTATRSLAEITATNPLAKVSFAYASEARQKIALLGWAAANFKSDATRAAKAAFLVFGVGGIMSQVLKNLWKEAKGDDDEKKWSPENLIRGSVANAFHGIPMASEFMGEPGMLSSATWAKSAAIDVLEGDADMRDVNTLLGTLGLFNDTAAGIAALSNAGYDFAKIIEAAFSDASNK